MARDIADLGRSRRNRREGQAIENLGYEKDPICRTDVRGLEHSAEYFLEKVVFGVVPWLEISSLERLLEA